MTTTVRRLAFIAATVPALALGAPIAAMADAKFVDQQTAAGKHGASLTVVRSVADEDGKVSFKHITYTVGPKGAAITDTHSSAR
ncbi:hypothetical protein ACFOVU_13990 [Nocardiopsis sediminis]|uniref:Uncharacterized protein n=1 Tax=Nocardiopsis sediminis TaxID=1778267 RepID=A0ABV8FQQ1_9ACTN